MCFSLLPPVSHVVLPDGRMPSTYSTLLGILAGCWVVKFSCEYGASHRLWYFSVDAINNAVSGVWVPSFTETAIDFIQNILNVICICGPSLVWPSLFLLKWGILLLYTVLYSYNHDTSEVFMITQSQQVAAADDGLL